MARRYIIPCILLYCLFGCECERDLSRVKIIEIARKLCTGQDICSTNTSQISSIEETSVCCMHCSCDPSCRENENCCFPDQAYPIGNGYVEEEHGRSVIDDNTTLVYECLYPSSPQLTDVSLKTRTHSFWMISEILNKPQLSNYQKCGHRKVAPWGSFLPVSSKKTGYIYKNMICAKEHGVKEEDVVVWKGSTFCNNRGMKYFDLGEAYLNRCPKRFHPPPNIIQRSSLCFNDIVDTCPEQDFTIPTDLNMSHSEVIKACTSGLLSPYRIYDLFANVFCHICNGFLPERLSYCPNLSVKFDDERTTNSISGLIDYDYLQSLSRDHAEKQDPRLACIGKDTVLKPVLGTCRIIQCPIGQVRNSAGECFFVTPRWSNADFKLCMQLTSDKPFNIRHYFPDLSVTGLVDVLHLRFPFPKLIRIESLLYKPLESLNDTDEILISIATSNSVSSFKWFINEVEKSLKKNWLFHLQNTTISLKARIASEAFLYYVKKFTSRLGTSYQSIYSKGRGLYKTRPMYLTKLYFCENVQLEENEFDISSNDIVFNKISNRSFSHSEYSFVNIEQNKSCRVCLDESGFIAMEQDNSIGISLSFGLFIMFACPLLAIG